MRRLLINWSITVILFAVLGMIYYFGVLYFVLAAFLIGLLSDYLSELWNKKKKIDELQDRLIEKQTKLRELEDKLRKYESKEYV